MAMAANAQQWASPGLSWGLSSGWLLPSLGGIKVVMGWLHVGVILCFPWHPGDSSRLCQLGGTLSMSEACLYYYQYFIMGLSFYILGTLNSSKVPPELINLLVQSQDLLECNF